MGDESMPFFSTLRARWRPARQRDAESRRLAAADGVFRRFFDLIGRLERPLPYLETKSEPERKLRITRLDEDASRKP